MAELGEAVAFALFEPLTATCPFKVEGPNTSDEEAEAPAKDDLAAADEIQANNGGTLGENMAKGSPAGWGKSGTINDIYPPSSRDAAPREDSKTDSSRRVKVGGQDFGYIVAAHHLVPGEAALAPSTLYKNYMKSGGSFSTPAGKTYTLKAHIGYNVNGNHNGVWLPGNYAIRATKPDLNPTKTSWSSLIVSNPDWCYGYMMACVEQAHGQFHDSHAKYSAAVLDILDKVSMKLALHQDACADCKSKTDIYPPYVLKERLYLLSQYLRMQVRRRPGAWKDPWITSDRFKDELMKKGHIRPELVTPPVIYL